MKALILTIVAVHSLAPSLMCQGIPIGAYASYAFRIRDWRGAWVVDAPVFDWNGDYISGPGWRGELYGGAEPNSLSPVIDYHGGAREIVGLVGPGVFYSNNGFLCVPTVPAYGTAWLQVRVWDVRLGATYEDLAALDLGGYGQSALFQAKGGNTRDDFGLPFPLIGLQSFSVSAVVPEPSSGALLLLGGLGLCRAARRRKQQ